MIPDEWKSIFEDATAEEVASTEEEPLTLTVALSDEMYGYIDFLVEEGRFDSFNAAVEAALRMMWAADQAKDDAYVLAALEEADRSGPPIKIDLDQFRRDLVKKWQEEDRAKSSSAAE